MYESFENSQARIFIKKITTTIIDSVEEKNKNHMTVNK